MGTRTQTPQHGQKHPGGFCVVDVETTGFGRWDRIIEIGMVQLDRSGNITREWGTLVNPNRDVGATHIHRIDWYMIKDAPRFSDIADWVAEQIDGRILVAHNAKFDLRFITAELERNGHHLDADPVCTLELAGTKLEEACQRYGIALDDAHEALADARATGQLLQTAGWARWGLSRQPAKITSSHPRRNRTPKTVRRADVPEAELVEIVEAGNVEEDPFSQAVLAVAS